MRARRQAPEKVDAAVGRTTFRDPEAEQKHREGVFGSREENVEQARKLGGLDPEEVPEVFLEDTGPDEETENPGPVSPEEAARVYRLYHTTPMTLEEVGGLTGWSDWTVSQIANRKGRYAKMEEVTKAARDVAREQGGGKLEVEG